MHVPFSERGSSNYRLFDVSISLFPFVCRRCCRRCAALLPLSSTCSGFCSMPSRLLRTSADQSDGAFLSVAVNNQISIYSPVIHPSNLIPFSLILFILSHLSPAPRFPCPLVYSSDLIADARPCSMHRPQPPRLSAQAAAPHSSAYEPASIPSSIRTHIALPPRLPLRPQHEPMQHATTSDFFAFPLKQQPLSRPPSIGLSMSSAASICAWNSWFRCV